MNPITEQIRSRVGEYASLPFWSWNDKLDPAELCRQMHNMKDVGMGGAFMHARAGLMTEYLSDEWFDCINACIDEAEKLGMTAWAYDENGWPSGFADGKLLGDKSTLLTYLEMRVGAFPADDGEVVAVYEKNADGSFTCLTEDNSRDDCVILYKCYDECYVDTLNGEVTDRFLDLVYEEYKKRLPADKIGVGKPMPGFFTDEPHYAFSGTSYSRILPSEFFAAYGYQLTDALPALFFDYDGADKHRYDYYYLIHRLFINNFIKKLYDWCVANGFELTGHTCGEEGLSPQMSSNGGVMPFYAYETVPGIDYLDRYIKNDTAPKQLSSVRAQLGKKYALSEMYGCCGWDVTPFELKKLTDMQYANGVNLMCQHLYPYSEKGVRKRDFPNHYSESLPWQYAFGDFNRYYSNLGSALSVGHDYAPILFLHPQHSAFCKQRRGVDFPLVELESKFNDLIARLRREEMPYHFGDEWLMAEHAHVDGKKLVVGECAYDAVLVPFVYSLDESTVRLLRELLENGGKVCLYDGRPIYVNGAPENGQLDFLKSTATFDDLLALRDATATVNGAPVDHICKASRITDSGDRVLFFTNVGDESYEEVTVTLPGGCYAELDVASLALKPLAVSDKKTVLRFREGESHLLVSVTAEEARALGTPTKAPAAKDFIPIPDAVRLAHPTDNVMTLDYAARSNDGVCFDEPMFLMGLKDNLLRERYAGKVWLKYRFTVNEGYTPTRLKLAVEPMYESVTVNGTPVSPSTTEPWFDRDIGTVEIAPLTHVGVNEIVVEVNYFQREHVYYVMFEKGARGALRNNLRLDTEIEYVYLIGDFGVRTDGTFTDAEMNATLFDGTFSLDRQPNEISSRDAVRSSFPFYAGRLDTEFDYDYAPGKPTVLKTNGRHAVADISVNGTFVARKLFDDETDLAPYLRAGRNVISVSVCNSMRNTLGPHHRPTVEYYGIGPAVFSFENEWHGRECTYFRERYAFIRYGIRN